ncbi:MAG: tryptophan--tRNA ligase [Candidatus Poribacteria bacterium]|nr:tryptophan--tRNA ligase [Candidatus Poribacteria bacterium]MDE0503999.1 tryptophan--tRNA ligase [Candidatus Poribacteria bacterium]
MNRIALTGIKPTGPPHIGNYLGMIKPALELAQNHQALYFLADYHALTTVKNREKLIQLTYEVVAAWIALGLNPDEVIFYRQSDIIEVFELTWILNCFAAKGLLNRAHAYKAIVDDNLKAGRDPDKQINMGLYNYPVLMAADILLYGSHVVPVGLDQKQHLEMTRDIAETFNKNYGEILVLPEASIKEEVMTIPGTDGRKMSASYNNTLPVFAPPKELRKRVMRIVTDSKRPEDPKDPESCNVFAIFRHFAAPDDIESTRQRYIKGELAYGDIKTELFELLESTFGSAREFYNHLLADRDEIDRILIKGAEEARAIAMPIIERVRKAVGVAK